MPERGGREREKGGEKRKREASILDIGANGSPGSTFPAKVRNTGRDRGTERGGEKKKRREEKTAAGRNY